MTSQEQRNQRLDSLAAAVQDWGGRRKKELTQSVATAKTLLKARGGADRLADNASQAASDLVVQEIDDFLVGS